MLGLAIGLCKGLGPLRVILSRFSGVSGFLRGGETVLGIAIGLCKGLGPLRVILSRLPERPALSELASAHRQ